MDKPKIRQSLLLSIFRNSNLLAFSPSGKHIVQTGAYFRNYPAESDKKTHKIHRAIISRSKGYFFHSSFYSPGFPGILVSSTYAPRYNPAVIQHVPSALVRRNDYFCTEHYKSYPEKMAFGQGLIRSDGRTPLPFAHR